MKITAVIVARKGSTRIPSKMHQKIGLYSLLERKIRQLRLCAPLIDEIVVGSDDTSIKGMVQDLGARFIKREKKFCDEKSTTPNDMVRDMCSKIECDIVLWAHPTNPFIGMKEYVGALEAFGSDSEDSIPCDSLVCVTEIRDHFWSSKEPLNHNPWGKKHVVAADLKPLYRQNGGIFIRFHKHMKKDGRFVGQKPIIYAVDEKTGWDINHPWELAAARGIFKGEV